MFRLPPSELKGKEVIQTKAKIETMEKYILDNPRLFNVNLTELIINDQISFQFTSFVCKLLESLPNLVILGAIKCQIRFITRFPKLPNLKVLILDHNNLNNEELGKLVPYKFISLSLMDNALQIHSEETLVQEHLSSVLQMKQLEMLSLSFNPGMYELTSAQYKKYQKIVFTQLPALKYLDNYQRDGTKPMSKLMTKVTGLTLKEEAVELGIFQQEGSEEEADPKPPDQDQIPIVMESKHLVVDIHLDQLK